MTTDQLEYANDLMEDIKFLEGLFDKMKIVAYEGHVYPYANYIRIAYWNKGGRCDDVEIPVGYIKNEHKKDFHDPIRDAAKISHTILQAAIESELNKLKKKLKEI